MTTAAREKVVTFELRGGNYEAFTAREREICVEGPSGTGKTRTILELLHALCLHFPGVRLLMARKWQVSMASSCLRTFDEQVNIHGEATWFGGSKAEPASYRYANGSRIVVTGLDVMSKTQSTEFDIVYINEATEASEDDWETLTRSLRGTGKLAATRIIGDCNPVHGTHWLNKRCELGKTRRIVTSHKDNPRYFLADGTPTPEGAHYMATLSAMSGSRRERFFLGLWTGVENACYPHFDREVHIMELPADVVFRDGAGGADYGRVHKAATVAISVDQYGRRWVREAWGKPDLEHGSMTAREFGRMWRQYSLRRGAVDPNQDVLIGMFTPEVIKRVSLAEGSRQNRIDICSHYFGTFPGGRPTSYRQDLRDIRPHGPFVEPDTAGLLLVKGAPGIVELAEQLEAYHYVHVETDRKDEMLVARVDEDLVAAMEYACWSLEQPWTDYSQPLKSGGTQYAKARVSR